MQQPSSSPRSSEIRSARDRNDFIQYLRAYAALMVVLDHSALRLARADNRYDWLTFFAGDFGSMGVQIFFVISGYIMVSIANDDFAQPGAAPAFWLARIKRIVPLYTLATATMLLLPAALGGRVFSLGQVAGSLLFLPIDARPEEGYLRPVLGVGWTLNYEMFFYLVFGISLLFRRRAGLAFSFATLGGLVVAGRLLAHHGEIAHRSAPYFYTWHIMLLFAAGMAIGLWRRSTLFRQFAIPVPSGIGAILVAAMIVVLDLAMPGQYPSWRVALAYAVALISVLLCVAAKPRPVNLPLELLGNASFSMYLFHGFALTLVIAAWDALLGPALPYLRVATCVAAGGTAGVIVYHYLEKPIVRFMKPGSRQARRDETLDADLAHREVQSRLGA